MDVNDIDNSSAPSWTRRAKLWTKSSISQPCWGFSLPGDDADTALPGIWRVNSIIFERATALREALRCA